MRDTLSDLLAAGVSLFGQGSRLLKLRFGERSGIGPETLLPHKLHGEEGLSKNYHYSLECLSADTFLELKTLLGQPAEISLLLPDGTYRLLTGLVTAARQAGSEGGFAAYVLTLEPALATLVHRRNSRVFQDRTVPQIVTALLDEHLAANPAFTGAFHYRNDLVQSYPVRSYCLQYRESDLAFIERLLAEEGISYRYTHGPDPDTSLSAGDDPARSGEEDSDDSLPRHTLILVDDNARLPASRISREADESATRSGRTDPINRLRFHRTAGVESADALDDWTATRAIQAGRSQLASYDYQGVTTHIGDDASRNRYGQSGDPLTAGLEDYDVPGAYYGADPDEMARYTALRQQARDLAGKTFSGQGTARHLVPGTWFELLDHPIHDQDNPEDRQFLVTGLTFEAQNNLIPEAKQSLGGLLSEKTATQPYRNTLTAVRRHVPVVPDYRQTTHQKPTAGGLTTATVVGPEGEEIYTDEHGRIKIQFHWQRKQDHPEGGADRDDHSSTWVRVAYPSAGAAWGSQYIPRIGQEVVIDFLEGDIDRPLVTGVVYNGTHRPPTFSGAGTLPANKTLSGHKSKEYQGSRYNELLFDDSTNEIRTKLSSEHGKTQLNQGYLIHPRTEGKGEPRGEGFELRTDESGALRAAKGLLLSTWQRLNATDKQLARDEALALMQQSLELFKQFGEYAAQHEALPIDPEPQDQLKQKFQDWENGSNTQKDGTGTNGGAPIIGFTAPAGINTTTPESLVSYAGKNIDTVAQQHLQQTAGQRFNLNAGKGISLFAHEDGVKAIAHHGKMLIQSQHDDTQINAEQNVTVTASQGKITTAADQQIVWMTAGGAYLKLAGGKFEMGAPGGCTIKAGKHVYVGPARMGVGLPGFPDGLPKKTLHLNFDHTPEGIGQMLGCAGMPYKLFADGAKIGEGVLDGETPLTVEHEVTTKEYKIEFANGVTHRIPVAGQYTNPVQGQLANAGILRHEPGNDGQSGGSADTARERYGKALRGDISGDDAS
jgi:type VI secretion system secreted protein VgrG